MNWITEARLAHQGTPTREAAMADTSRTVYMIVFDDHDRPPEVVIGDTRAAYRFHQVSAAWNAHLFVKLRSNSRDDPRYADNIAAGVALPSLGYFDLAAIGERHGVTSVKVAEILKDALGVEGRCYQTFCTQTPIPPMDSEREG